MVYRNYKRGELKEGMQVARKELVYLDAFGANIVTIWHIGDITHISSKGMLVRVGNESVRVSECNDTTSLYEPHPFMSEETQRTRAIKACMTEHERLSDFRTSSICSLSRDEVARLTEALKTANGIMERVNEDDD